MRFSEPAMERTGDLFNVWRWSSLKHLYSLIQDVLIVKQDVDWRMEVARAWKHKEDIPPAWIWSSESAHVKAKMVYSFIGNVKLRTIVTASFVFFFEAYPHSIY